MYVSLGLTLRHCDCPMTKTVGLAIKVVSACITHKEVHEQSRISTQQECFYLHSCNALIIDANDLFMILSKNPK